MGLEIDSIRQLVSVPQEKLQEIISKVSGALESEKLTLRELQSLVGSLSFICRAVPPGRAFLRHLIDLQIGIKKAWHKIRISPGAKADLRMWLVFLNSYNGSSIFMNQNGVFDYELQWFTDASGPGIGFGGFFDGSWFQGKWPDEQFSKSHSIAWLEFFPIIVAVVLWGHSLQGKRIVLRCDNEAVVAIINKQSSKCPQIMRLLRFFVLQCLKNSVVFSARHVAGRNNDVADALSRFQMQKFWKIAPGAKPEGLPVPAFLWDL